MAKSVSRPPNGPSTTGKPSGKGRGNNPPAPKPSGKAKNSLETHLKPKLVSS